MNHQDTIVAQATAPGRGGIGIVRITGPLVPVIMQTIFGKALLPRQAAYRVFYDQQGQQIDQGIGLFFPKPHSFTGEDTLELQGHGSPVVMDALIQVVLSLGARLARPGEFSERAFLNEKIDLLQAEAIAGLINSASLQAARAAMQTLQGAFSRAVETLTKTVMDIRKYVEAAIDFSEEEIDFLSNQHLLTQLQTAMQQGQALLKQAEQGVVWHEGVRLTLLGAPNVGKSTLLNQLCGQDKAIVTDIPGTTRDIMSELIQIHGIPFYISDTAGIGESQDRVELEGIKRAKAMIPQSDHICLLMTWSDPLASLHDLFAEVFAQYAQGAIKLTIIRNKIDQTTEIPRIACENGLPVVSMAAKQGIGLDLLRTHLSQCYQTAEQGEGVFMAQRRHRHALERALESLEQAILCQQQGAAELVAEELRQAQHQLAAITGSVTTEDLLREIFANFCIGK